MANPIVKFTYNQNLNQYDTSLADGTPGAPVSLNDMYTMKELAIAETAALIAQEESTTIKVELENLIQKSKTISNDLNNNMGLLIEAVNKLVNTLNV